MLETKNELDASLQVQVLNINVATLILSAKPALQDEHMWEHLDVTIYLKLKTVIFSFPDHMQKA